MQRIIRHPQRSLSCYFFGTLLLVTLAGNCFARPKKDVIQFNNGDRITCEIVKLEKGYLYVKLEYAEGTIAMDWSKIARLESPQSFVVADKTGKRYTGTLQEATTSQTSEESKLQVTGTSASEVIPTNEVVGLNRTDTSFWQNLHGGIDAGLNFSKQQSRTQYNFQTNALFQRAKWAAAGDYQSSFSGGGGISNVRNDLKLNTTRQLRSQHNFYMGLAEFLQSNEQQLDLRTTLGGAVGHLFSNTNNSFVSCFGGVVWNREHYSSEATVGQTGDSAEAVIGTQLNFFRFKKTNILANASLYPSLTEPGRVRFDMNTSMKIRIAKDLYWNLGYFLDVDSRPPQNLSKTDYGSTSGLGWTF